MDLKKLVRIIKNRVEINRRMNMKPLKLYPTTEETDEIISEIGEGAYCLYEYYLKKGLRKDSDYSDEVIHKARPYWSVAKIKRNRLRLTKLGYFKQINTFTTSRDKTITTYLGKKNDQ